MTSRRNFLAGSLLPAVAAALLLAPSFASAHGDAAHPKTAGPAKKE